MVFQEFAQPAYLDEIVQRITCGFHPYREPLQLVVVLGGVNVENLREEEDKVR